MIPRVFGVLCFFVVCVFRARASLPRSCANIALKTVIEVLVGCSVQAKQ